MRKLKICCERGASLGIPARRRGGAGRAAQHRLHHPFVAVEHVLAGGEEGLRRRLREDPGELPDDLHADGRLDRRAAGQHADGARRQSGRADHLDRRQQRLRRPDQGRPRQGRHRHRHQCRRHRRRQGQCAPGLHRPGLHPGRLYARQGAVDELPEGRPDPRAGRRLGARPELVGAARPGRDQLHGGLQEGQSGPRGHGREDRFRHRPRGRRRSRRRLSQRPSRHHRLFRHRLLARRRRPRAHGSRRARPARCCSAASTSCRR